MNWKLTNIGRPCGFTRGSLKSILFLLPEELASEGVRLTCPVVSLPEMQGGETMYLITHDIDSGSFNEQSKSDNRHGDYFEQTVNFAVKRSRIESTRLAEMLMNRRIHAILEDYQGEKYYMKYFRLRSQREIDAQRKGYNGWRFSLVSRTRKPLPHIKAVPASGVIDCSEHYDNIDILYLIGNPPSDVLADDFLNVISDDF